MKHDKKKLFIKKSDVLVFIVKDNSWNKCYESLVKCNSISKTIQIFFFLFFFCIIRNLFGYWID